MKIVDGAYASMIRRIESGSASSFLLLRYSQSSAITDLVAIHRSLITPEVIIERKPLSHTAKRAGWVGCNILLGSIPPEGRIPLIENGIAISKESSRAIFAATEKLGNQPPQGRNWSRALLKCLHLLPTSKFTLDQAYRFEQDLSKLYPENKNVRPKIRQQLQVLRDAGLILFEGRGCYRLVYGAKVTGDALL
jgi:type II restriction enzyme